MSKLIDFNMTIYELSKNNPEIIEIMSSIGFNDITKPGMISTAGRFMTIAKGAATKKIDLDKIKEEFIQRGYDIKE